GINATFANAMAKPGNVAFISQSGALLTAVLDWSFQENVGFSSIVSLGSMLDVGWGDMIDYLGNDPHTQSIVIYMETIGDARAFLSAAREVALTKPILVIKAGRTEAAAKAAASHTGSLAGSQEVLEAAFRRCGVLSVDHISHLFYMADVLSKQPRPKGPRLCLVTNAGGPGVLATDALIGGGGKLAGLSPQTQQALSAFLPAAWSHGNPVDVLGDADPERFAKALADVTKDPENDGVMVILTPQAMTDPTETARRVAPFAKLQDRPILASWMGGAAMEEGRSILNQASLPCFPFPDTAARLFNYMWRYSSNLKSLYETPSLPEGAAPPDRPKAGALLAQARQGGRDLLSEYESKSLLAAYGIPTVDTRLAQSADEAAQMAEALGYPVVLKLHSFTVTHKTDVGGVKLNLTQAKDVRQAFSDIRESVTRLKGKGHFQGVTVQKQVKWEGYELILGSSLDPQVGPVLLFGSGGQLVEVYKDHALGLPPLNTTLARRLMERTKIYGALKGVRGRAPVDLAALEQLLVRFSWLIAEQPAVKEMDINPLLASPEGLVALDARVVLHPKDTPDSELSHTAIRPYPAQYVTPLTLKDGTHVTLRPIRPEDEPAMVRFHETLSAQSVYLRYFQEMKLDARTAHERLTRTCFVDYGREMVLVALQGDQILGVARFSRVRPKDEAEFSMILSDAFQNRGLGGQMLKALLAAARDEKLRRLVGYILPENVRMQALCAKLGFTLDRRESEGLVVASAGL
ncbi:MAG TPA: bifunctional acetate--CoA ligase family protein/GNAT family N-acetyltransferase, partial [bacterium]|nr:bifunctional acetate--CoA ligase family protein/GNAT family N-acetyltransferase [bacterium]